jgi:hypothetical protein
MKISRIIVCVLFILCLCVASCSQKTIALPEYEGIDEFDRIGRSFGGALLLEDGLPYYSEDTIPAGYASWLYIQTVLHVAAPDDGGIVASKSLTLPEQEEYAGVRLPDNTDEIMFKTISGARYYNDHFQAGRECAFPEQLIAQLRKERPYESYYCHFDVTSDLNYVYYTDDSSLFRYDLQTDKTQTLLPELLFKSTIQGQEEILPYRLSAVLLTPGDQFCVVRIAGFQQSHYIYNIKNPEESFLTNYLPVWQNWANIQNFLLIPDFEWVGPGENFSGSNAFQSVTCNVKAAVVDVRDLFSEWSATGNIGLNICDMTGAAISSLSVRAPDGIIEWADMTNAVLGSISCSRNFVSFAFSRITKPNEQAPEYAYTVVRWDIRASQETVAAEIDSFYPGRKVNVLSDDGRIIYKGQEFSG